MNHRHVSALATLLGVLFASRVQAQELTIGDAAPDLDITHWMNR